MRAPRFIRPLLYLWLVLSLTAAGLELPEHEDLPCCCGDRCYMACADRPPERHRIDKSRGEGHLRPASDCADSCPSLDVGQHAKVFQPFLEPGATLHELKPRTASVLADASTSFQPLIHSLPARGPPVSTLRTAS